jgi:hypothetical protein
VREAWENIKERLEKEDLEKADTSKLRGIPINNRLQPPKKLEPKPETDEEN